MDARTVGWLLWRRRTRLRLSRRVVAEQVDRSERWLYDIETGHGDPRLSELQALARILEFDDRDLSQSGGRSGQPITELAFEQRLSNRLSHGVDDLAGPLGTDLKRTRRELLKLGLAFAGSMTVGDSTASLAALEGAALAENVTQITAQHEWLRRRTSGRRLLEPVVAHLHFIEGHLRETWSPPAVRLRLISAYGEVAVLAGRLSFWDLHDPAGASKYFKEARKAAHEAGDEALDAYALAFTAELLTYLRRPSESLDHITAARRRAARVAPRVQSWLAMVQAEAQAHLQEGDDLEVALEQAHEAMGRVQPGEDEPPWINFFDEPRLAGYEGACLVKLRYSTRAIQVLDEAAQSTAPSLAKYQAEITADAALAHAQIGDFDRSRKLLASSFDFASPIEYGDGLRRIRDVQRFLKTQDAKGARRG